MRPALDFRRAEYAAAQRFGYPGGFYVERGDPCMAYSLDGSWWGLVMWPRPSWLPRFEPEYSVEVWRRLGDAGTGGRQVSWIEADPPGGEYELSVGNALEK